MTKSHVVKQKLEALQSQKEMADEVRRELNDYDHLTQLYQAPDESPKKAAHLHYIKQEEDLERIAKNNGEREQPSEEAALSQALLSPFEQVFMLQMQMAGAFMGGWCALLGFTVPPKAVAGN